nr:MarR family transcriptional regulator [Angustibacter aerolatus]
MCLLACRNRSHFQLRFQLNLAVDSQAWWTRPGGSTTRSSRRGAPTCARCGCSTRSLRRGLERHGLSHTEYEILVRLSESPGRTLRMSDLASSVVSSRSRLTHTAARLESEGLVRRRACAGDRRGVNCELTEKGFEVLDAAAHSHVEDVRSLLLDAMPRAEFLQPGRQPAPRGRRHRPRGHEAGLTTALSGSAARMGACPSTRPSTRTTRPPARPCSPAPAPSRRAGSTPRCAPSGRSAARPASRRPPAGRT